MPRSRRAAIPPPCAPRPGAVGAPQRPRRRPWAARRPPGPGHGGRGPPRLLALPPPDLGVLDHAVEDDPGGVMVLLLRGLRWRLSRQVVPRLRPRHALAAGEGWDRTAGPQLGLSARRPALEQAAKRPLRWDPRRPGRAGGRQGHLAAASAQAAGCRWAPARSRSPSYWCGCTRSGPMDVSATRSPCSEGLSHLWTSLPPTRLSGDPG
jgi:hypothetical protein